MCKACQLLMVTKPCADFAAGNLLYSKGMGHLLLNQFFPECANTEEVLQTYNREDKIHQQ